MKNTKSVLIKSICIHNINRDKRKKEKNILI